MGGQPPPNGERAGRGAPEEARVNYRFRWSVLWTGESGQWLLNGLITTLELSGVAWLIAIRWGSSPARSARCASGRCAPRPPSTWSSSGTSRCWCGCSSGTSAVPPLLPEPCRSGSSRRARVLGRGVRARRLQRRALLGGPPLRHPVDPAHPARGVGGLRAHHVPGLPLRDPAGGAAAHHPARHQRVAQPAQELVGGAHDQRGRAHVPDAADRDLHREGHRGAHRGHPHLPGALRVPGLDHVAGSSGGPRSRA